MGRGRLYLTLHCHHQNDFCVKMGGDVSHFNVSLLVREKVAKDGVPIATLSPPE